MLWQSHNIFYWCFLTKIKQKTTLLKSCFLIFGLKLNYFVYWFDKNQNLTKTKNSLKTK